MKHTVDFKFEGEDYQFDLYTNSVKALRSNIDINVFRASHPLRLALLEQMKKEDKELKKTFN